MQGKLTFSHSVVASPLLPAPDTAYGLAPVKERGRFVVLALPILDDKGLIGVVGVDR